LSLPLLSIVKFRAALASDPSHLLARYNLACAYSRSGDPARGIALLNELARPGCGRCRGILAHATEDDDWRDQWRMPAFVALTSDAVRAVAELRGAAKAIAKTWRRCEAKGLVPFIDPTTVITLDENHCCFDNPKDGSAPGSSRGRRWPRASSPSATARSSSSRRR